jgi:hypothetical protein
MLQNFVNQSTCKILNIKILIFNIVHVHYLYNVICTSEIVTLQVVVMLLGNFRVCTSILYVCVSTYVQQTVSLSDIVKVVCIIMTHICFTNFIFRAYCVQIIQTIPATTGTKLFLEINKLWTRCLRT